ncbi:FtsQ-type POTRA domain-containing protein [Salinibacterium sp. PAMC 21357]|uniref:FtsQ-type POTRA domain-containing protein n=1 Tax=Salinibacterium sp. PAMC 21357 TaxID=1112215 RepID=UPI001ED8F187|nr:FtsQ-type POTRA domain-containing protein [Salinibacterium sp. PAMC 21357]
MKRPEGFDKPAPESLGQSATPRRKRAAASTATPTAKTRAESSPKLTPNPAPKSTTSSGASRPKPAASAASAQTVADQHESKNPATKPRAERRARPLRSSREPNPDALAKKRLRQAARARKRAERAELRRFTRRARNRKIVLLSIAGLTASLLALIAVAVFSPILALRSVVIDGTNRIAPAEIQAALESQMGTPLALLDFDVITEELSVFPLIRSYVTEIVPPDTLLVHIVEREPIGAIQVDGVFRLVDPAGITIQESAESIAGVPLIDVGGADTSSSAFAAVTEVLLTLPADLRVRVTSASATTKDDVSFVLSGVGQGVVWGSASESARKAALLARLIERTDAGSAGEFDVSAPSNGIFRPS